MGKVATGNTVLSCLITEDKKEYIKRRADACRATKSVYGSAIIDYWLNAGAPPLFDNDKHIKVPVFTVIPRYSRDRPARHLLQKTS
jgi:hypothetical protein